MRVLSISHRLQNPQVDNHTIFNAPAIHDYDAIVVDVGGVSATIRDAVEARSEFLTHADLTVVNGETAEGAAGLAELLQRRRDEVARALERGATVVVYAAPPARIPGVAGYQGLDRYFFLPAPDGMAWDTTTVRGGEGPHAVVADHHHPFVPVMEAYAREVMYRAYFNDRAPGFSKHAHVFLRSTGGAPIGVEFPVSMGRVVFMPTARRPGVDSFAAAEGSAMVAAAAEHLGQSAGDAPRWVLQMPVPGLAERDAAVEQARIAFEQAEAAFVAARDEAHGLSAVRDVLWAGGDTALTSAVLRCLEAIGFTASETPEGHALVTDGGTRLHVAVGGSDEAVDMTPHYRLRQRLDAIVEKRAVAERGLVVANGQRLTHPDERKRQMVDALRVAAEATRYAVLPATSLFTAAVAALDGTASADTLAAVRQRLASTDGLVELDDLLSPPAAAETGAEAVPADTSTPEAETTDEDATGVTGARAGEVEVEGDRPA